MDVALDPSDELFIVHVASPKGTGKKSASAWEAGGPLMHSLQVHQRRSCSVMTGLCGRLFSTGACAPCHAPGVVFNAEAHCGLGFHLPAGVIAAVPAQGS